MSQERSLTGLKSILPFGWAVSTFRLNCSYEVLTAHPDDVSPDDQGAPRKTLQEVLCGQHPIDQHLALGQGQRHHDRRQRALLRRRVHRRLRLDRLIHRRRRPMATI